MNIARENNRAIFCLTKQGAALALRLGRELAGVQTLYLPKRLAPEVGSSDPRIHYMEAFDKDFAQAFHAYTSLICIMATGIVVRQLAPLMVSKYTDPAVVVVDEAGQFAISLLSGHVGGANRLAEETAQALGAQAVITTATDVQGQPAVDTLAASLNCLILQKDQVKLINRHLAENQRVYLSSPYPLLQEAIQGFTPCPWEDPRFPLVTISPYETLSPPQKEGVTGPLLQMLPQNLIVGVGCRKDVSQAAVEEAITQVFAQWALDMRGIKALATIDFKTQEPGLMAYARQKGWPLLAVSKEAIAALEGTFTPSPWVKKTIGVGGVCEPAAKQASKKGHILVPKQSKGPVTISVAVEKSWWLAWDLETETSWPLPPWKR